MSSSPARGLRAASLAAAVCAALLSLPAAATPKAPSPPVPVLQWQPCGAELPGLDCALARVPLDYDNPAGPTISLALARSPATNRAQRIGSLFLNPGGPGGSGVDLVLSGFGEAVNALFLDGRFDVIGFDPRGVGFSTPVQCFDSNEEAGAFFAGQPVFPWRAEQERPFFETSVAYAQRCLSRGQSITRHMSTADVARDLDLLRRAVGDRRLNYLGYSYGSYLGATYANLFPQNVRALAIDGVLNPVLWSGGLQIAADRTASAEVLGEFFRLCDAARGDCALAAAGGSKPRFDALLGFVRREPILLGDGAGGAFEYGYDLFVADSALVMYSPEDWPLYAEFLDALNDALFAGDTAAAARALVARRTLQARLGDPAPGKETPYDNGGDAFNAVACADTAYPSSLPLFQAVGRFAEAGSFQGPFWWWGFATCARWPTAKDRYIGPWSAFTSAPVLVVGNFFDPATDYNGAVATDALLPNSRLLSYAGWGHTAAYSGRSACVDDAVSQYLLSGALPPRGTVCPAAPNPFASATASRVQRAALPPLVGRPAPGQGMPPLPSRR